MPSIVTIVIATPYIATSVSSGTARTTISPGPGYPIGAASSAGYGIVHVSDIVTLVFQIHESGSSARASVATVPCCATVASSSSIGGIFATAAITAIAAITAATSIATISSAATPTARCVKGDPAFEGGYG